MGGFKSLPPSLIIYAVPRTVLIENDITVIKG